MKKLLICLSLFGLLGHSFLSTSFAMALEEVVEETTEEVVEETTEEVVEETTEEVVEETTEEVVEETTEEVVEETTEEVVEETTEEVVEETTEKIIQPMLLQSFGTFSSSTIDAIIADPSRKAHMAWEWTAQAGEQKCITISYNQTNNRVDSINWGEGADDKDYGASPQTRCKTYSIGGNYTVEVMNPWAVTQISGLSDKHITDFWAGGNGLPSIDLSNNNLSFLRDGVINTSWSLKTFNVSNNELTTLQDGVFSSGINQWITEMDFSNNAISSIGDTVFSYSNGLQKLNLGNNALITLPDNLFQNNNSLLYLDLSDNLLTTLTDTTFSGLSKLGNLNLENNDIESLSEGVFAGVSSLWSLNLNNNAITVLSDQIFAGLSSLSTLLLESNAISVLPENVFAGLPLTHLSLRANAITALGGSIFAGLSSLGYLDLQGNNISFIEDGVFQDLSSINGLNLGGNKLKNLTKSMFLGLTGIKDLFLGENEITSLDENTFEGFSMLKNLHLSNNVIKSLGKNVFKGLTTLDKLYLQDNQIESLPSEIFSDLSSLTYLELSSNKFQTLQKDLFSPLQNLGNGSGAHNGLWLNHNLLRNLNSDVFDDLPSSAEVQVYGNYLDPTINFSHGKIKGLTDGYQKVFAIINYTPTSSTYDPVTGTVAFVGGKQTDRDLLNSNEPIYYVWLKNGSYTFDLSGITGANLLGFTELVGTVTWIMDRPSVSGGGGGSIILHADICPNGDYSPSYYDGECGKGPQEEHGVSEEQLENPEQPVSSLSEEDLFQWLKDSHLTSKETLSDIKMKDTITRAEMAKLISIYATTILKKDTEDNLKCSQFTDINQVNAELQSYIVSACNLGLMGYDADGETVKEKFNPTALITRAEVATTLSRMLRGNLYRGYGDFWYQNHLLALVKKGIVTEVKSPTTLELRGDVFAMLSNI